MKTYNKYFLTCIFFAILTGIYGTLGIRALSSSPDLSYSLAGLTSIGMAISNAIFGFIVIDTLSKIKEIQNE